MTLRPMARPGPGVACWLALGAGWGVCCAVFTVVCLAGFAQGLVVSRIVALHNCSPTLYQVRYDNRSLY
jgi:hypothetical protein